MLYLDVFQFPAMELYSEIESNYTANKTSGQFENGVSKMSAWMLVCFCFMGILFIVKLGYLITAGLVLPVTRGALFVPASQKNIQAFLKSIPMSPNDIFVDLGCGDGRVLRAARRCYDVKALGFDINPLAFILAGILCFRDRGIQIKWGNFLHADLSGADIIFCYLFPDVLKNLGEKFREELHPGAKIVSCNFPIPGWSPVEELHPGYYGHPDPIYIYQLPDSCFS